MTVHVCGGYMTVHVCGGYMTVRVCGGYRLYMCVWRPHDCTYVWRLDDYMTGGNLHLKVGGGQKQWQCW